MESRSELELDEVEISVGTDLGTSAAATTPPAAATAAAAVAAATAAGP